jgi:hypothetical protein
MRATTLIGILLIALGVVALVYKGISYTSRERVVDLGPIQATADTKKTIPMSPVVGAVALVSGVVLIIAGGRSKAA